jgi:hypothetical protein
MLFRCNFLLMGRNINGRVHLVNFSGIILHIFTNKRYCVLVRISDFITKNDFGTGFGNNKMALNCIPLEIFKQILSFDHIWTATRLSWVSKHFKDIGYACIKFLMENAIKNFKYVPDSRTSLIHTTIRDLEYCTLTKFHQRAGFVYIMSYLGELCSLRNEEKLIEIRNDLDIQRGLANLFTFGYIERNYVSILSIGKLVLNSIEFNTVIGSISNQDLNECDPKILFILALIYKNYPIITKIIKRDDDSKIVFELVLLSRDIKTIRTYRDNSSRTRFSTDGYIPNNDTEIEFFAHEYMKKHAILTRKFRSKFEYNGDNYDHLLTLTMRVYREESFTLATNLTLPYFESGITKDLKSIYKRPYNSKHFSELL